MKIKLKEVKKSLSKRTIGIDICICGLFTVVCCRLEYLVI
jgi:hypothetical protein